MANEIAVRAQLSFAKGGSSAELDSLLLSITMSGVSFMRHKQSVGTAEEALVLGEVNPINAYFCAINRDVTNFISIRPASGGTVTAVIRAGEVVLFRFGGAVAAPYVQADTAACLLDYLLIAA